MHHIPGMNNPMIPVQALSLYRVATVQLLRCEHYNWSEGLGRHCGPPSSPIHLFPVVWTPTTARLSRQLAASYTCRTTRGDSWTS